MFGNPFFGAFFGDTYFGPGSSSSGVVDLDDITSVSEVTNVLNISMHAAAMIALLLLA